MKIPRKGSSLVPNMKLMSLTRSPLSHPGWGSGFWDLMWCHYTEKKSLGSCSISTFSALISSVDEKDNLTITIFSFNPFPNENFRVLQTERVCRRNSMKICRKFSKWVENTVEKGEIARYEQFLLFPTVFSKDL